MRNTQAPANYDPGFMLPGEAAAPSDPVPRAEPAPAGAPVEIAKVDGAPATDTSTRDAAIGGGVFLVLLIAYFFLRNAYVHHLVVKRVGPSSAGSAGWLLFVGLAFVSAAAVLAVVNASKFLNWTITAPLVLVVLVALVAAMFVGRR